MIRPFENQIKKCPKSQMFRFKVFCIQIVTVLNYREGDLGNYLPCIRRTQPWVRLGQPFSGQSPNVPAASSSWLAFPEPWPGIGFSGDHEPCRLFRLFWQKNVDKINVTERVWANGTTSVLKSVLRLVLGKVRFVSFSEVKTLI